MKPIQLKKNYIDIPFTDDEGNTVLNLRFERTDENVAKVKKAYTDMQELSKLVEESNENDVRYFLEGCIDSLLGQGAFLKIYNLSHSLAITSEYFISVCVGLAQELNESLNSSVHRYMRG